MPIKDDRSIIQALLDRIRDKHGIEGEFDMESGTVHVRSHNQTKTRKIAGAERPSPTKPD